MTNYNPGQQPMMTLPYNPSDGVPVPVIRVSSTVAMASLPVPQFLDLVPDPIASENERFAAVDPRLAAYRDLRFEVQRAVEGAKKRNSIAYGKYIAEGIEGKHPWVAPPVTLYHEEPLSAFEFGPGFNALLIPFGDWLVAIDGETQRIGWQIAVQMNPAVKRLTVPVVIHHGVPVDFARQAFYDLNTREVKPNAAVALSMDTRDPATRLTRDVMESSDVLRSRVHQRRRQLRRADPEMLTMSALRTAIVTTILGVPGLQIGARPIDLPDNVDIDALGVAVVETWTAIVDQLEDELDPENRDSVVVSAPAILAGIGVVAHGAMPAPPRKPETESLSIEEVLERLDDIVWSKKVEAGVGADGEPITVHPWDGIAGKVTPAGGFSIGGPKEVGHTVAQAIGQPASPGGRRIRML